MDKKRVNFMLRLQPKIASEIKELAYMRGLSANACAQMLLSHALTQAKTSHSLNDRLSMMGVR